jgi:predicted nucleotidyltransferase
MLGKEDLDAWVSDMGADFFDAARRDSMPNHEAHEGNLKRNQYSCSTDAMEELNFMSPPVPDHLNGDTVPKKLWQKLVEERNIYEKKCMKLQHELNEVVPAHQKLEEVLRNEKTKILKFIRAQLEFLITKDWATVEDVIKSRWGMDLPSNSYGSKWSVDNIDALMIVIDQVNKRIFAKSDAVRDQLKIEMDKKYHEVLQMRCSRDMLEQKIRDVEGKSTLVKQASFEVADAQAARVRAEKETQRLAHQLNSCQYELQKCATELQVVRQIANLKRDDLPAMVPVPQDQNLELKRIIKHQSFCSVQGNYRSIAKELRKVLTAIGVRGPKVRAYGSIANGFADRCSDLDLVVVIPQRKSAVHEAKFLQEELIPALIDTPFKLQEQILHAKVPLVNVSYGEFRIDITVNNFMPLLNTCLLKSYSTLDSRVVDLVILVKHWAKSRGIRDAKSGNLPSYSWTLLAIFYLQVGLPVPLIPSLQRLAQDPNVPSSEVTPWKEDVQKMPQAPDPTEAAEQRSHFCFYRNWENPNKEQTKEWTALMLFNGFTKFYADIFDWGSEVVSIRLGRRARINEPEFQLKRKEGPFINIEDPMELKRNLNVVLSETGLMHLKNEFKRATQMPFPALLE